MDDVRTAMTLDAKCAGDLVYVFGETKDELGASEYYCLHEVVGTNVPMVDPKKNGLLYRALSDAITNGLVASAQSIHRGGLGVALAKTAVGGMLGMNVTLTDLPGVVENDRVALWSESQGRIVVTVAPEKKRAFEQKLSGNPFKEMGVVRGDPTFTIAGIGGKQIVKTTVQELKKAYESTFKDY